MSNFIDELKEKARQRALTSETGTLTRKELAGIMGVTPPVVTAQLRKTGKMLTAGSRIVIPIEVAHEVIDNYYKYN